MRIFILISFGTLLTLIAWASTDSPEPMPRDLQRANFLLAERFLEQGKLSRFRNYQTLSTDYPLYPYLEYFALRKYPNRYLDTDIEEMLKDNQDSPISYLTRRFWLNRLAKKGSWNRYANFLPTDLNQEQQCNLLSHQLSKEAMQTNDSLLQKIWLTGESLPKSCDPLLSAWYESGFLTPSLVWQRINLAFKAQNYNLGRFLRRYLPESEQKQFSLWWQLHKNPQKVVDSAIINDLKPMHIDAVVHAIKRLSRSNPQLAYESWKKVGLRYSFSSEMRYELDKTIALTLPESEALPLLATLNVPNDDIKLLRRRLRIAINAQQWPQVIQWIEALPAEEFDREQWRYWYGHAFFEQKLEQDAESVWRPLANERGYYAFLAADRLNLPYKLETTPLQLLAKKLKEATTNQGLARALELNLLGYDRYAKREWHWATQSMPVENLKAAAHLAKEQQWHDQAIITLAKSAYWDDLEFRFPLAYRKEFAHAAKEQELAKSWLMALTRQESIFSSSAQSPAGAIGLMQLMPKTAKMVAGWLKLPRPKSSELHEPQLNITLGSTYLGHLAEKYSQNPVLATAAYNAGPHRVDRWLEKSSESGPIWIESIPFKETRDYVKRVLTYRVIYQHLLGQESIRLSQMIDFPTPSVEKMTKRVIKRGLKKDAETS